MAYHFDTYDSSLVIDGFEKGIADSPFAGIADLKNVNIISVPGEASVNFSTTSQVLPSVSGSVTSADSSTEIVTATISTGSLFTAQAVVFSGGSLPAGISAGTTYWVNKLSGTTFTLYTDPAMTSLLNITGTGTGTFISTDMGAPTYGTKDSGNGGTLAVSYYVLDANGRVWQTISSYFRFIGNTGGTGTTTGNGIICYSVGNPGALKDWLFVFRESRIDYVNLTTGYSWVYGWVPSTGATGSSADQMNTSNGTNNPHDSLVGQDNVVYFTDGAYLGSFFVKTGQTFDPTNTATYTYAQKALSLPMYETAQCLAELGTNLLVGGVRNAIYPWDRASTSFSYPILIAENSIQKLITVNTNTFIFAGNRGRIYYTNGSQAMLYKKIPDHISGTIEPYFTWGGVCTAKNQLYFSAQVKTNAGVAIGSASLGYGGLWAIDMDTKAIRLSNILSYGTYLGYATVIMADLSTNPAGTGLYIGWNSGASTYGVDYTSSNPYITGVSTVDSDLIPVGTFNKPRDMTYIEYRLTKPLVSGESIELQQRLDFSLTWTSIFTDSTTGNFSNSSPINFKNAQWLQLRAVLSSTTSSPSYVRLKEIRIAGFQGQGVMQQMSV